MAAKHYDEIGDWTEAKLEILQKYATAYSKILSTRANPGLTHVYIDGFAGYGLHVSERTHGLVKGSPLVALSVTPQFKAYHFVDLGAKKVQSLETLVGQREDVCIYKGDCNRILLEKVFPQVQFKDFRRGLCLLDPYGLHLEWAVLKEAGQMKTLDVFLNFPIMDINMNVLKKDPKAIDPKQAARMTAFWGDDSWRAAAYPTDQNLFGDEEKTTNEGLVKAFRERLKEVAGFACVPQPVPMKNKKRATVYYLFFASAAPLAEGIVRQIFKKYQEKRR